MRWLLWRFCLLAESYETINHYHYGQRCFFSFKQLQNYFGLTRIPVSKGDVKWVREAYQALVTVVFLRFLFKTSISEQTRTIGWTGQNVLSYCDLTTDAKYVFFQKKKKNAVVTTGQCCSRNCELAGQGGNRRHVRGGGCLMINTTQDSGVLNPVAQYTTQSSNSLSLLSSCAMATITTLSNCTEQ